MAQPPPLPSSGGPPTVPSAGDPSPPPLPGNTAPAKKGANKILLWGCGILGVLFLLGVCMVIGGLYFVKKKANEAGINLNDLAKESQNETLLAAKMIAAMSNGEITVLSADDVKKTVTIRVKSSGQTMTLNLNDLSEGKFPKMPAPAGSQATISQEPVAASTTTGSGDSAPVVPPMAASDEPPPVLAAMSDATLKKFPSWIPLYPGAKTLTAAVQDEEGSLGGQHIFFTRDEGGKVAAYFMEKLSAAGLKMEKEETAMGDHVIYTVHGATEGDTKKVDLAILKDASGTNVTLGFSTTPPASPAP